MFCKQRVIRDPEREAKSYKTSEIERTRTVIMFNLINQLLSCCSEFTSAVFFQIITLIKPKLLQKTICICSHSAKRSYLSSVKETIEAVSLKRFGQKNFIRLVISFKAVDVKTSYAATYFSSGFEGLASRYEDLALGPFEDSDDSEDKSLVEDL